ncbi:MAG: hypothetical protein K2Q28_03675 [Hyphomicrobium sp.]|nr:hypothetical protein [Hyphomicrobium sp.]
MTLQGIIIRADGVIAETDGLERSVLNQVIQSAGFNWTCTREACAGIRAAAIATATSSDRTSASTVARKISSASLRS